VLKGWDVAEIRFLTDPVQLDTFERYRQRFARQVLVQSESRKASPEPLEALVATTVVSYRNELTHGFRCFGIAVAGGDGMSWSAHAVDRAIEDVAPDVRTLRLVGTPGRDVYPELTAIISMRRIASIAQKHGLVQSVRLLGPRRYLLIAAGAVLAGVVAAVLTSLGSRNNLAAQLTWRSLAFSAALGGLALLAQQLSQALRPDPPALAAVAKDIAGYEDSLTPGSAYQSFIEELAAELTGRPSFRCVIVDDFTALDRTTRLVVEAYLKMQASDNRPELWIIFYLNADKLLDVLVNKPGKPSQKLPGIRYTKLYRLEHLTLQQRRDLAREYGYEYQATYLTVRAIACDYSGLTSLTELFRQECSNRRPAADGSRIADALDFFYIFALNATQGSNAWFKQTDIRQNLSRQRRYRTPLLQLLLPRQTISPTVISHFLTEMSSRYFAQSDLTGEIDGVAATRKFRAAAEAGQILAESWREFGLADPALVHLFWTLYWADTELHGEPDVSVLQRISMHMLKSGSAVFELQAGGGAADSGGLTSELFNIAIQVLRACLRVCLLADVPDLLSHALSLTEDDDDETQQRRRARLRPLAWEAYGLLGEEKVLSVIFELAPAASTRAEVSAPATADAKLSALFVESMPGFSTGVHELMRNELSNTDAIRTAAVYAGIRASWLAASAIPFTSRGAPLLTGAEAEAHRRLPGLVGQALTQLEATVDDGWRTTDILNVILGVWALTLTNDMTRKLADTDADPASCLRDHVDALESACLLGLELTSQRRDAACTSATVDLVLDCLAEELLAVAASAGVLLLNRWPDSVSVEVAEHDNVVDLVRASVDTIGLTRGSGITAEFWKSSQMLADVEQHMTLMTLLWRRLGFNQQASFMAIRQAQFMALIHPRTAQLAEDAFELLGAEFKQPDHVGLLAHIAAAECSSVSQQLTAELLRRCSEISIKAGSGDRLAAEFCFSAVEHGHSFEIDFASPIDFLLSHWRGDHQQRLATLLDQITEPDLPIVVLEFLNTARRTEAERSDRVYAALQRRTEAVDEPEISTQLKGNFRIFALQKGLAAGQSVDASIEMDEWQDIKHLPTYAYMLSLVMPKASTKVRDRVITAAIEVLRTAGDYLDTSGYIYLGLAVLDAERSVNDGRAAEIRSVAIKGLKDGFPLWERHLSADANLRVLRILLQNDAQNAATYQAQHLKWVQVALELDETQRLPRLLDQGSFFLLFWHYFQFFADYGFQSSPPVSRWGLTDDDIAAELDAWRADHRWVPEPTTGGDRTRLSGEFLSRGYALFFQEADPKRDQSATGKDLAEGRREFDQKARESMNLLYAMLCRLPQLPKPVEQILRRHEEFVLSRLDELDKRDD
jgi:hypothetical protein